MISWKTGLGFLVILGALIAYATWPRPAPKPAPPRPPFFGCTKSNAKSLQVAGTTTVQVERSDAHGAWQVVTPSAAPADRSSVEGVLDALDAIAPKDRFTKPSDLSQYGLDQPTLTVTCATLAGPSYTLGVGAQTFDSSGYFLQKSDDSKVYVVPASAVDALNQFLSQPSGATPIPPSGS